MMDQQHWIEKQCLTCKWHWTTLEVDLTATRVRLYVPQVQLLDEHGKVITGKRRIQGVIRAFKERDVCLVVEANLGGYTFKESVQANEFLNGASEQECTCRLCQEPHLTDASEHREQTGGGGLDLPPASDSLDEPNVRRKLVKGAK